MQLVSNEIKTAVEIAMLGLVSAVFAPGLTAKIMHNIVNLKDFNKDRDVRVQELHKAA